MFTRVNIIRLDLQCGRYFSILKTIGIFSSEKVHDSLWIMNNNDRVLTYASRILSFIITLMVTRLRLGLIKLKEIRKPTNLHDSRMNVTSTDNSSTSRTIVAFILCNSRVSIYHSSRRKLFFIARCIHDSNNGSAHVPFILATCVLAFDRRAKWDTVANSSILSRQYFLFCGIVKASNCRQISPNH